MIQTNLALEVCQKKSIDVTTQETGSAVTEDALTPTMEKE